MNLQKAKKIRKGVKNSFVMFLRNKPRYLPKWIWKLSALIILNDVGIEMLGVFYGLKKTTTINGVKYKIK